MPGQLRGLAPTPTLPPTPTLTLTRWDERSTQTVAPALRAGELLLFDFRVMHRGRANHSAARRPVGYVVFARRGVRDLHNFSAEYETLLQEGEGAGEGGDGGGRGVDGGVAVVHSRVGAAALADEPAT